MNFATIGLGIAKNVCHLVGADARGRQVLKRHLERAKVLEYFTNRGLCLIGIEACGGARSWARQLPALEPQGEPDQPQVRQAVSARGQERLQRCRFAVRGRRTPPVRWQHRASGVSRTCPGPDWSGLGEVVRVLLCSRGYAKASRRAAGGAPIFSQPGAAESEFRSLRGGGGHAGEMRLRRHAAGLGPAELGPLRRHRLEVRL